MKAYRSLEILSKAMLFLSVKQIFWNMELIEAFVDHTC